MLLITFCKNLKKRGLPNFPIPQFPLSKVNSLFVTRIFVFRACLEFFKLIINSLWFWRNIGEGVYRDK